MSEFPGQYGRFMDQSTAAARLCEQRDDVTRAQRYRDIRWCWADLDRAGPAQRGSAIDALDTAVDALSKTDRQDQRP